MEPGGVNVGAYARTGRLFRLSGTRLLGGFTQHLVHLALCVHSPSTWKTRYVRIFPQG